MAYNPGNQDISGQLLARGIEGFANNFQQAREAQRRREEEEKKRKEEIDAILAQNKALETVLKGRPDVDPAEIDQLLAPSPDESPRARNVRLRTVSDGLGARAQAERDALQRQQIEQQMMMQRQQAEMQQAAALREESQRARMRQIYGGQPDPREIAAILQTGGRFEDTGPGTPPSDPQSAMRAMIAAGIDPRVATAAAAASAGPPRQFVPRIVDVGGGMRALMTSDNSAVPVRDEKPEAAKPTELGQLIAERDAYLAAGRQDIAAAYDAPIATYRMKTDAFGQPVAMPGAQPAPAPYNPIAPAPLQKGAKTKQQILAELESDKATKADVIRAIQMGALNAAEAKALSRRKGWE
jgi:hypothetical protein